jgi:two-component sensor histidine kinase
VPSLTEVVRAHTALSAEDRAWLSLLLADWQILADLSFADLVLWLPDRDGGGFWAAAQMRPTTGPTALVDDVVGTHVRSGERPLLEAAYVEGRIAREGDPEWRDDVPVRVEAIPVRRDDRVIGVVARNTNLQGVRTPSRLELSYLQAAADLSQMIARGLLPQPGPRGDHADSPRVGDGFIRVDAHGRVGYASPNALSVYRKLGLAGDLAGQVLADLTRALVPPRARADEETISAVLGGRVARDTELGNGEATVVLRSIPLAPEGAHAGALVLLRDVTDLRRRDRELVTKDATIREIHHRVKNNLQTVAALLRLQSRRLDSASGRAALDEAVRRVAAIAVVHETLSQSFDESVEFDAVVDQLARLIADVGGHGDAVRIVREGTFGLLSSEAATPLAMVVTELMQNAVEHAYPRGTTGRIAVCCRRTDTTLEVEIVDDGVGLPDGFDLTAARSLGLSIVETLVEELGGSIGFAGPPSGGTGTAVRLELPVEATGAPPGQPGAS